MKKNKKGRFIKVFLFIVFVSVIFYITWFSIIKLKENQVAFGEFNNVVDTEVSETNTYKTLNIEEDYSVFGICDKQLIKCTKEYISGISVEGILKWTEPINMNTPIIDYEDNYAIIFDANGRDLNFVSNKGMLWSKKMENKIRNASYTNEYITVVCEPSRKSEEGIVFLYDKSGYEVFRKNLVGHIPIFSDILVSGKTEQLFIVELNVLGLQADTWIEFHDLENGTLQGNIKIENATLPLSSTIEGILAIGGEEKLYFVDKRQKQKVEKKFINEAIINMGSCGDQHLVIALFDEEKFRTSIQERSRIIILDSVGKVVFSYYIEGKVRSISNYSDICAIATNREILFVQPNEGVLNDVKTISSINNVIMISKKEAAVITIDEIIIIPIESKKRDWLSGIVN